MIINLILVGLIFIAFIITLLFKQEKIVNKKLFIISGCLFLFNILLVFVGQFNFGLFQILNVLEIIINLATILLFVLSLGILSKPKKS